MSQPAARQSCLLQCKVDIDMGITVMVPSHVHVYMGIFIFSLLEITIKNECRFNLVCTLVGSIWCTSLLGGVYILSLMLTQMPVSSLTLYEENPSQTSWFLSQRNRTSNSKYPSHVSGSVLTSGTLQHTWVHLYRYVEGILPKRALSAMPKRGR